MKIVVVIARVFLGFIFVFFGSNGFLNFLPAPPLAGVAGAFLGALMSSHYVYMVCAVQILAVCAERDLAKAEVLRRSDLTVASNWWTKPLR